MRLAHPHDQVPLQLREPAVRLLLHLLNPVVIFDREPGQISILLLKLLSQRVMQAVRLVIDGVKPQSGSHPFRSSMRRPARTTRPRHKAISFSAHFSAHIYNNTSPQAFFKAIQGEVFVIEL